MRELREAHDRAKTDASFIEPDPSQALSELAASYPGALREIDALPLPLIGDRIRLLEHAERREAPVETWMLVQIHFHRFMRGALAAKRWLGKRRDVTDGMIADFAAAATDEDGALVACDLAAIARPPRGRLSEYACAKVAAALGLEVAVVKAAVLPPRR